MGLDILERVREILPVLPVTVTWVGVGWHAGKW